METMSGKATTVLGGSPGGIGDVRDAMSLANPTEGRTFFTVEDGCWVTVGIVWFSISPGSKSTKKKPRPNSGPDGTSRWPEMSSPRRRSQRRPRAAKPRWSQGNHPVAPVTSEMPTPPKDEASSPLKTAARLQLALRGSTSPPASPRGARAPRRSPVPSPTLTLFHAGRLNLIRGAKNHWD